MCWQLMKLETAETVRTETEEENQSQGGTMLMRKCSVLIDSIPLLSIIHTYTRSIHRIPEYEFCQIESNFYFSKKKRYVMSGSVLG